MTFYELLLTKHRLPRRPQLRTEPLQCLSERREPILERVVVPAFVRLGRNAALQLRRLVNPRAGSPPQAWGTGLPAMVLCALLAPVIA